MSVSFDVQSLHPELSFGARVHGVTRDALTEAEVRSNLNRIFEDRGLIVFENVEPSSQMQVALSNVFGPLKDHPVPTVGRVDQEQMPGVIDMTHSPSDATLVEMNGKVLDHWLPWHFDHCYNSELNRAGVLRAIDVSSEGGLTDMLIWDNWRMLHCVSGSPPQNPRRMQRTTIKGDYGLGRFENNGSGNAVLENTMV
jgi:taurine dioxygenase